MSGNYRGITVLVVLGTSRLSNDEAAGIVGQ